MNSYTVDRVSPTGVQDRRPYRAMPDSTTLVLMSSPRLSIGRIQLAGIYYAITTNTRDRRPLLRDDIGWLVTIAIRNAEHDLHVENQAWVVMPDHVHWIFELRARSMSQVVARKKSQVTRACSSFSGRSNSFWQEGFYDHRVRTEADLYAQSTYIIHNPVRKGWVISPSEFPFVWCRHNL